MIILGNLRHPLCHFPHDNVADFYEKKDINLKGRFLSKKEIIGQGCYLTQKAIIRSFSY